MNIAFGDICIDCAGAGRYPSGAKCKSCEGSGRVLPGDGIPSDATKLAAMEACRDSPPNTICWCATHDRDPSTGPRECRRRVASAQRAALTSGHHSGEKS